MTHTEWLFSVVYTHTQTHSHTERVGELILVEMLGRLKCTLIDVKSTFLVCIGVRGLILVSYQVDFIKGKKKMSTVQPRFIVQQ